MHIETREESRALHSAAELIADEYRDDTRGGEFTPEIRSAIRKAWISGRDWARNQEMVAQIEENRQRAAAEGQAAVNAGLRLLGCPHTVSCTSVAQCDSLPTAR
jgi:hypothetical protein